jgi:hypothetical protein
MSILWKMVFFIAKYPGTSSNCYKTIKTASTLIKLGTNVNLTIAYVKTCSVLNFLLPWYQGEISKLPKKLFCVDFFSSNWISKCFNFSMDWDRVKGFSAMVTRHLIIDLESFLAPHSSNIFLAIRGTTEKVVTFKTTFLKQKQVFGAWIRHFSPFETTNGCEKGIKMRVYRVMG